MCAMNDVDDDVVSLAGWLVGWDVAIYISLFLRRGEES